MIATLTRRRLLFAIAVVMLLLVALMVAVQYIGAQEGKSAHIYNTQLGDDRIVAVVNGVEVPFGAVRKSPEAWLEARPELTEDQAYQLTIVGNIDRFIMLSEVERRGLMPTAEEGMAFMQPYKEACLSSQACRDSIRDQGETLEAHWERVAPYYREDLGITRLHQALLTEAGLPPDEGTSSERAAVLSQERARLRAEAEIEWQDQRLANLYETALSPAGQEFRQQWYENSVMNP